MTARILIIEDEEPLTLLLRYNIEEEGLLDGDCRDLRFHQAWKMAHPASYRPAVAV
jgi:hypothetical protein